MTASRQAAVLAFVTDSYRASGVPPTAREIGMALGAAPSSIYHHLMRLTRDGYLRKDRRKYIPVTTTAEGKPAPRPVSSCPWGETAHEYAESMQLPVLFCRKCGGTVGLPA